MRERVPRVDYEVEILEPWHGYTKMKRVNSDAVKTRLTEEVCQAVARALLCDTGKAQLLITVRRTAKKPQRIRIME